MKSCTVFGVQADGREITTVEGLRRRRRSSPIQEAFKEEHGLQCGFCTPGMMLVGTALLEREPRARRDDDVRWAISGNICRCTGYMNIVEGDPGGRRREGRAARRGVRVTARIRKESERTMATEPEEIRGIGHSVKRKEDDRFIRGQGNYIDDIVLPRMLHMAILRSPYAHAKINVDRHHRAAAALPGVVAVVTGELMAQHNLAWMPTLSGDTQAVLATDKVRFQGQEVAAVIAEDPYVAIDALELIDVDYDPLAARRHAAAGAGGRRAGDPRRQGRPDRQPHLPLGDRRQGGDRRGVRRGRQGRVAGHPLPARATRRRWRRAAASPT